MKFYYGIFNNSIDVTEICLQFLKRNNIITIPAGDSIRSSFFTDPVIGESKNFFVSYDNNIFEYNVNLIVKINILNNDIQTTVINVVDNDINDKLIYIQSQLKINYGDFNEEVPEQKMAVKYLTGNEKILEIGGNIGRNSLIIGKILKEKNNINNYVVLESNKDIAEQLRENRDLNNMDFFIENSALSKRKLIQKGWDTIESEEIFEGFTEVSVLSLDELNTKYNIIFDTLVLDCEGAFYYILMDMPEILKNIKLIIMENDYYVLNKKEYVDDILIKNNFYVEYVETGGWGPCRRNFFEVWKKVETWV
jgi:FkbM family methyltransferase